MPARIRRPTRSKTTLETNRSEKPSLDASQVRPPSVLRTTPAPSVPRTTMPPGRASTALMMRSFCVICRQVAEPSSLVHSPSVVPAKRRFWSSGLCANARVRRLLEGIPLIFVQRVAVSSER
jgi:hypothetical protein